MRKAIKIKSLIQFKITMLTNVSARLKRHFTALMTPTKIKVFIPNKEIPENVGSRPVFELKYSVDD